MCVGFGGIITRDGQVLFGDPDADGDWSHESLLERLPLLDGDPYLRNFVRFEFPRKNENSFRVDEVLSVPGWFNEEHEQKAKAIYRRVLPALDVFHAKSGSISAAFRLRIADLPDIDDLFPDISIDTSFIYNEYRESNLRALHELIEAISTMTGYVPYPGGEE